MLAQNDQLDQVDVEIVSDDNSFLFCRLNRAEKSVCGFPMLLFIIYIALRVFLR